MNCFTHGLPFLERPIFMVGCCVPDWLSTADRKCRTREKLALPFINHQDQFVAELAQGIVQHHHDDHWFHQTQAFTELSLDLTKQLRELLDADSSFRPSLLGHVLIELLLDAYLHEKHPGKLSVYYDQVASVDAGQIQQAVNLIATKPTDQLVHYHRDYVKSRFLFDYADDAKLFFRLNGILRRVKLHEMDDSILSWLPIARSEVSNRATELLEQYPVAI